MPPVDAAEHQFTVRTRVVRDGQGEITGYETEVSCIECDTRRTVVHTFPKGILADADKLRRSAMQKHSFERNLERIRHGLPEEAEAGGP